MRSLFGKSVRVSGVGVGLSRRRSRASLRRRRVGLGLGRGRSSARRGVGLGSRGPSRLGGDVRVALGSLGLGVVLGPGDAYRLTRALTLPTAKRPRAPSLSPGGEGDVGRLAVILSPVPPRRRPGPNGEGRRNGALSSVSDVPQLGPGLRRGGVIGWMQLISTGRSPAKAEVQESAALSVLSWAPASAGEHGWCGCANALHLARSSWLLASPGLTFPFRTS